MAGEQQSDDDLDLLLSLHQDRVLETPPSSPRYDSDNGSPRRSGKEVDMSVFRNAVKDCLDYTPQNAVKSVQPKQSKGLKEADVEKFSGLRIRNQLVSPMELSNRLTDIRFVRLQAIKNVLNGDILSGCWATIGVLVEIGVTRKSSAGKNFCIWKVGCLDENTISVFMFGEAYTKYSSEKAGTIFGLFNSGVRKDNKYLMEIKSRFDRYSELPPKDSNCTVLSINMQNASCIGYFKMWMFVIFLPILVRQGGGFSLSVYSAGNILKIGTSPDFGVCNGKKPDGNACTIGINKRRGIYCQYHKSKQSQKYSITRNEYKGGNLNTAFRDFRQPEGVYMVDPFAGKKHKLKSNQPLKLLSVDCLKKALSNAGKVTTNVHSQGIRFLNEVTEKYRPEPTKGPHKLSKHQISDKRIPLKTKLDTSALKSQQLNAKRRRVENKQPSPVKTKVKERMIELDFVSSDEET